MKIGIVSGTSINRSALFETWETIDVPTEYGDVSVKNYKDFALINRHGFESPLPPHAINYRANIAALDELGVEKVLTVSSVGSLRPDLVPGTVLSCSDYVSFKPRTFVDDRMSGFMPIVDNDLVERLEAFAPNPIARDKVYVQTPGPRFETKAEVRILQMWGGDVVGMTFANEADLILEKGMRLSSIAMVDNFAHGIGKEQLTLEQFESSVRRNQQVIDDLLGGFVS